MLHDAARDLLAFAGFPAAHWKKIWLTNPGAVQQGTEAAHRRGRGVPNTEALQRLAGAVHVEAHDEWQATDRRYLGETTMALLTSPHRRQGSHAGTDDGRMTCRASRE